MSEKQLLLVVDNRPTDDNSHPWNQANVITEIECARGALEGDEIISDKSLVSIRALTEKFGQADRGILASLRPGQWIEVEGNLGGPLKEIFFPISVKVRDDLPVVVSNMPEVDDLYSEVFDGLFDEEKPKPLRFPARTL